MTITPSKPRERVLELRSISRSFGAVQALSDVTLSVYGGEVLSIVGENGAGKSTLVTIAAGVLTPSAGTLTVGDTQVHTPTPQRMRDAGIAVAFQHPALPPDLTVLECLSLVADHFSSRGGAARASDLMARIATPAICPAPQSTIRELSIAQKHVVEIARALATEPRLVVFDEPTEALQEADAQHLFALIGELRRSGTAVVFISHRLQDVMAISDRVAVLRDGRLVADATKGAISQDKIVELIVGQPLEHSFPEKPDLLEAPSVVRIENLTGPGFANISLSMRKGEIVGVVGVEGQGQREFVRALAGAQPATSGSVTLGERKVALNGRSVARSAGIAFVPDDRHAEGLFLPLSVRENISIGLGKEVAVAGVVAPSLEGPRVRSIMDQFQVRPSNPELRVGALSGGNQQKVLIGREVGNSSSLVLVDEPTKGVDVGARLEIYRQLRELSSRGTPVLVCSSDGVELEGLCDRVFVFERGQIVAELSGSDVTDANITGANLSGLASSSPAYAALKRRSSGPSLARQFAKSVYSPVIVLCVLAAIVALAGATVNTRFFMPISVGPILVFVSALAFVSFAQLCTILIGEIDLSVGPLVGLVVVLASFLVPDGGSQLGSVAGALTILALTMVIGIAQGLTIFYLRLPSIVVTLGTFFGFQGVSLLLRPLPAGAISLDLRDAFSSRIGPIPLAILAVIAITCLLEYVLYRRRLGRSLRASGSGLTEAAKLGVSRLKVGVIAFGASGLLAGLCGLVVAGQVGIGVPTTGIDYTLLSVTAVVLGGASIAGGRGSFVATAFGALLVQLVISTSPVLKLGPEWNYWITGATTLLAAGLFSFVGRLGNSDKH